MPGPGLFFSNETIQSASKIIQKVYAKTAAKVSPYYQRIFNDYSGMTDAKRSFFQVLALRNLGLLKLLPEGQAPTLDAMQEGELSTFNLLDYALAYAVTRRAMEYDPKAILSRLPSFLAYSEQISEELLVWLTLNLGFLNAGAGGYNLPSDGLSLFNTAHPIFNPVPGAPSTMSNSGGTLALSVESLHNSFTAMNTTVDDRGLPTYRTPRKVVVGTGSTSGTSITQIAKEVLGAAGYPYSDENRPNVVADSVELEISRYFTLPTAWVVLAGQGDIEGDTHSLFYAFQKKNKQRTWTDPATENMYHSTQFTISYGAVDWRGTYGSQGS